MLVPRGMHHVCTLLCTQCIHRRYAHICVNTYIYLYGDSSRNCRGNPCKGYGKTNMYIDGYMAMKGVWGDRRPTESVSFSFQAVWLAGPWGGVGKAGKTRWPHAYGRN